MAGTGFRADYMQSAHETEDRGLIYGVWALRPQRWIHEKKIFALRNNAQEGALAIPINKSRMRCAGTGHHHLAVLVPCDMPIT
jgi:hypothetical protein